MGLSDQKRIRFDILDLKVWISQAEAVPFSLGQNAQITQEVTSLVVQKTIALWWTREQREEERIIVRPVAPIK